MGWGLPAKWQAPVSAGGASEGVSGFRTVHKGGGGGGVKGRRVEEGQKNIIHLG